MTTQELDEIVAGTVERYGKRGEQWAWLAVGAYCLCLRANGSMGSDVVYRTIGRLGSYVRRRAVVEVGEKTQNNLGLVVNELARLGIPHTPEKADELKRRLCGL